MCLTISYLIFSAGEVSFFIASHLKTSRKLAVNLNDIKKKTSWARYTWLDIQIDRA